MTEPTPLPPNTVPARTMAPGLKFALELGPLLLFLIANTRPKLFEPVVKPILPEKLLTGDHAGLYTATAILMAGVIVALIVSYAKIGRVPIMPLVTAVLVLVFGGLTFYFQDPAFFKVKATILYTAFGLVLLGGLLFDKPLLPVVLDSAMSLTETGWRILTLRWGLLFFALAALNELVWRTQTDQVWAYFKFPGTVILIFIFTFSQVPLIMKHELRGEAADNAPEHL